VETVKQRWVVKPPPPLNDHEVAYIELGRMKAWVDRKLARLIYACWKRGWETEMCCEEVFAGMSHVIFTRVPFLKGFVEAVAAAPVDAGLVEKALEGRGRSDALWMTFYGYERGDRPFWVSEQSNAVIFPLACVPAYTDCVSKTERGS